MQPPKDPLDNLLDRWGQSTPSPDPLESEVWRRIAAADNSDTDTAETTTGFLVSIKALFARPSFSIAFATACVLLGLFLVELRNSHQQAQHNLQLVQSYLRLVDPLLASNQSAPDQHASDNLDALLTWMKNDLQLNDQQLSRIKNVHEQLSPHLLALANQVAQMQRSLSQFENERTSIGQVDFLEFARYVEQRHKLDRDCNESTQRLITEATDVMTPRQRAQYLQLLNPALNPTGARSL